MRNRKTASSDGGEGPEPEGLRRRLAKAQAENERLRNQKELLRAVFDHLPLMVSVASEDGCWQTVNRAWEETLGWKWSEIRPIGLTGVFCEIFPDPLQLERARSHVREGKREWEDFTVRTRDGRLIETTWMNVHLPDGRCFAIGQDITDRKRAEETLRASEQRFHAIYEYGPMGIAAFDLNGRITLANPLFCRIFGYERSELIGQYLGNLKYAADTPHGTLYIEDTLDGKCDRYSLEGRYRRKDGKIIWCAASVALVRDSAGEPSFGLAIVHDITDRKNSEAVLERVQAYLAESERLSHIGTWVTSARTGEIVFWSEEHYRIFGFDPKDGLPPLDAVFSRFHPDDTAAHALYTQAVAAKTDYESEFRIVLPDGAVRHVLSIGHPVPSESGEVVEYRGVLMDITERKRVERELHASAQQLRSLAAEMERVREEEGARISRELHDELGSSLTSLKWDLESCQRSMALPAEQLNLDALRVKMARMAELAESNLRTVKRICSELRPAVLHDLGIENAIRWQAKQFQGQTGIVAVCDLRGPALNRDQAQAVFRIVQEALTNVLRHSGAARVEISCLDRGGELELRIADDGRGITADEIASPLKFGLLGMRERARLVGGTLDIAGVAGRGTTVTVRIPTRGSSAMAAT